jgi:hypothetical protein
MEPAADLQANERGLLQMVLTKLLPMAGFVLAAFGSLTAWAQESQRQYLSGHDKDDAVAWQFHCTAGRNSNRWVTIPVPSNWELQGFGTFTYGYELGKVPAPSNVVQGRYRHTFEVPPGWSGQRVFLVFEGVMTDTEAWVNGQSAGPKHQGGYYRFKYEVTRLLKYGQGNLLEVTVDEESSDSSVNAAERRGDYWNFAGIYRPVYLEAVPPQFIERIAVDARADGTLTVDVYSNGTVQADRVEAQVLDLERRGAGETIARKISAEKPARLQTRIRTPRLWTAEKPNLYQIEVRLKRGATILHQIRQRFGFRTIEVRPGDGIYVNGARVMFKGVNRHTFWPDSGRSTSEKNSRDDIRLMKDMNMNAVRMSHYPPDQHFLDACDELGLYVLDELAGWHQYYGTAVGRKLVEEMVTRDVNHPSILFWDNGNEGGWNTALDGDLAKWDPQQRRVLHPWEKSGGVNTKHYPDFAALQTLCAGDTVFLTTEFLHGLYDGGAGAGLQDYWDVMRRSKACAGGFIWAFVDEAVRRPDLGGRLDTRGNLAPDGILGPYREKEGSYHAIKEIWSPVAITERQLPADFNGALTLENRYDFTDAQHCSFTWQLRKFRRPDETASGYVAVAKGTARPEASIAPGTRGTLNLGLPRDWRHADALALRADDPAGHELWTWVWPLPDAADIRRIPDAPGKQKVTAAETADRISIRVGDLMIAFSKQTGWLASVERAGKSFSLVNGPRPADGQATLAGIEHRADGPDYLVTTDYGGNMKSVRWRVRSNGWLQLEYTYTLDGPRDFFGVSFDYPEANVKKVKWLGNGPYRVWKNRLAGGTLNVWENEYNNTITGAGPWNYPEFKGFYSGVLWVQLLTSEGPITTVVRQDDLFLQVLTPEFPDKELSGKTFVRFPAAGISFLHAIPAIGSKFADAQSSGPQGERSVATGDYRGLLCFFFGR